MEIKKNNFFGNSTPNLCKNSYFILPFFSWEMFYSKIISKVPQMKDAYSEPVEHLRWSFLGE